MCVCVCVCLLGLIQLHVTYQVWLGRDFSVFLIEMSLSDCCVCSCFWYVLHIEDQVFNPQSEDMFGKWGHFGQSSQIQRSL